MEQYIKKSALVAEIKRIYRQYEKQVHFEYMSTADFMCIELKKILSLIDTLEVKEVDFERELSKYVSKGIHRFFPNEGDDYYNMDSVVWQDYVIETAKHFFELGMAASSKIQEGKEV